VILRVDPGTGAILRTWRLTGGDVQSLSVVPGAVWVLQSGTISRLDPATGRVRSKLRFPTFGAGQIAAGDAGVWAALQPPDGPRVLVRVDTRARRVLKTIPAPDASTSTLQTRLAVGEGSVWWNTTSGTIWRIDPKTYGIVRAIRVTPAPAFPPDFTPLGIAAGAGGVWVTVTIGP
jgi:streptogramin lyase